MKILQTPKTEELISSTSTLQGLEREVLQQKEMMPNGNMDLQKGTGSTSNGIPGCMLAFLLLYPILLLNPPVFPDPGDTTCPAPQAGLHGPPKAPGDCP
jgi:hypothetical protein